MSRYPLVNPIAEGADPTVVRDGDRYLWTQSEGNVGVAIWVSTGRPRSARSTSSGRVPPRPVLEEVWAPELFTLDDRW